MTVTIHRDCRPTLDLRICRRECWIDGEETVATSSDWRVDACCLHCTPSARKQGQQDTRALCIHRIRSHSIESLFVTSSSLSWRHLYFIAYISISAGWHMQNKCWFFIKCIYELLIIPSPSLSANYTTTLLLVNTAAVPRYPLYRGRPHSRSPEPAPASPWRSACCSPPSSSSLPSPSEMREVRHCQRWDICN